MSVISEDSVEAGQAIYTQRTLQLYDLIVLGISNKFIWQCPTQQLLDYYNKNITVNHLDVGVGTGYFLDRCQFPSSTPRIALMDLNTNALEFAAQRLVRYQPERYCQNILEPITLAAKKFDSVGVNYLLHCLPGSIESKAIAFDHLRSIMNPNAVIFGSTLLQGNVSRNWLAKRLMGVYNSKGIFSNQNDDLEGLDRSINNRFRDVSIQVVGCVALFSGRMP
jgi:2-polyprenyl-3-methyl-5-hydroxy-6-metoxy-1,4-benzoquinol methylase